MVLRKNLIDAKTNAISQLNMFGEDERRTKKIIAHT